MNKRFLAFILLAALIPGLTGCSKIKERVADMFSAAESLGASLSDAIWNCNSGFSKTLDALGVKRSEVTIRYEKDDHGGFLGDGTTLIIAALPAFPEKIETSKDWRPLPLSAPLTELVEQYLSDELKDGNGRRLLPVVEHGFYCFVDRHSESVDPKDDSELLQRFSFNFTLSIYDTDTDTLYYIEFDT